MSLKELGVKELRKLAAKYKIAGRSRMRKAELLKALYPYLDVQTSPKPAKKAKDASVEPGPAKKTPDTSVRPAQPPNPELAYLNEEDAAQLPFSYDEDAITLLPKNPEQLYAYWDLSTTTWERIADRGNLILRLELAGDGVVYETMVPNNVREYYFRIPDTRGPFKVHLNYQDESGRMHTLLSSQPVKAPPNRPGRGEIRFVKVPFEISLPQLHRQGGPMQPESTEIPTRGFINTKIDDTPYTRRFK